MYIRLEVCNYTYTVNNTYLTYIRYQFYKFFMVQLFIVGILKVFRILDNILLILISKYSN